LFAKDIPAVLNICTSIAHSGQDVLDILSDLTGFKPEIRISGQYTRRNEVWRMVGDAARLTEIMGRTCEVTLREILSKMLGEY
jgi:nucleoside-diphosphate-sugar epimerase